MTLDPNPPEIHPTDAMLLLLGDVTFDADAAELVAELRLDAEPGALAVDDPFEPNFVAEAWSHLGACEQCSSRRRALFGELAPAIAFPTSNATFDLAATLDSRVRAAVAELVPAIAAAPETLARPAPLRRRWFAGRGSAGIGGTPGPGGAVARPWIVGLAAAALLLAVGGAFALRSRTTEQSAVGTVPSRVDRAVPGDTTSLENPVLSSTEAAAETDDAAAGAMADEPAANTPAIGRALPATTANPRVDQVTPTPITPEAAVGRETRLAGKPSPPGATAKTNAGSADAAADPVPPRPAKKTASAEAASASSAAASSAAASSAAAVGPLAGSEPLTAAADLGSFADASSALDRFATRAAPPTDAAATQVGQPRGTGSANAASPAATPLSAPAPPVEPAPCPTVEGSPRLPARIGDRAVLVIRTADATADVVLDAVTCAELARRSYPSTRATVGG